MTLPHLLWEIRDVEVPQVYLLATGSSELPFVLPSYVHDDTWLFEGFQRLLKELEEIGDFILTNNQQIRTDILLSESDSLREFLSNHVEKSSLDDVTSDELKESYASYCISQEWDPLPIRTIERQLPDLMLELFQTNKSNSIKRSESRSLRGYRGVRLKETYGSK